MEAKDFEAKPCWVILDPITPKAKPGTCLSAEVHNAIQERSLLTCRSKQKLLTDLKELQIECNERDRETFRAKTIEELLNTERSYIHQLKVIEIYFMKPIREQCLLSHADYNTIFSNIHTLRKLNEDLYYKFQKCHFDIANVFIEMAPYLKVYSTYAYYYKKSLTVLLNAQSNEAFHRFLELQQSRPEVQQKLSALLIAPIQRVPRYCLLLQQILNNTDISDHSYLQLTESLKKIQAIVEYIDNLVGYQEKAQRLIELQHSLQNQFPCIIKADRQLIKDGILRKLSHGTKGFCKKYVILMTDILVVCSILKPNINNANSLKCKGILPLHKSKISELSKGVFKLECEDVKMILSHKDEKELQDWIKTIKITIKTAQDCKRTLRKDSSSRRPVFGKFIGEYQEHGVSPGLPRMKRQLDFKEDDLEKPMPAKLTKRKCIRSSGEVNDGGQVRKIQLPTYPNSSSQDSLYPLRCRLAENYLKIAENSGSVQSPIEENSNTYKSNPDVYVFGANNQNRGFRFMVGSMFNGFGKSLKKLFGFRGN